MEKKEQNEKKSQDDKQSVRQLRHSFQTAIAGLLVLILVAVGTTYAWFSLAGRASTYVTPMGGTISEGSTSLLIGTSAAGPFDKTCDLVYVGSPDALKPVSTADLTNFYKVTTQNKDGIAVLYSNANANVDTQTLHGTVYLQCQNAAFCTPYAPIVIRSVFASFPYSSTFFTLESLTNTSFISLLSTSAGHISA